MDGKRPQHTPEKARRELARRHSRRKVRSAGRTSTADDDPLGISASYFSLRFGLISLAILLPVLLVILGLISKGDVERSLSAYYHASRSDPGSYGGGGTRRNIFVGALCAIGSFLFLYRGYSRKEDIALDIAGVAAIATAFFPTDWPSQTDDARTWVGIVHFASAAIFFVMIAFVCRFCAHETLEILDDEETRKRYRRLYTLIGTLMIAVPATITLIHVLFDRLAHGYLVLLLEVAGIWIFSIFWIAKSREIWVIERK